MPAPQKYIVGRDRVIDLISDFVLSSGEQFILNIFGPGGIGKTEVFTKSAAHCKSQGWIVVHIQVDAPNLTFDVFLHKLKDSLQSNDHVDSDLKRFFHEFDKRFSEYLTTKEILDQSGSFAALFDAAGSLIPDVLAKAAASVGKTISVAAETKFRNRYALQEYITGAEAWLAESFVSGIAQVRKTFTQPLVILVDTYEKVSSLDEWFCTKVITPLPPGIPVIIMGRDRLQEMGFHWVEYTTQINSYELLELDKQSTFDFYKHFGLNDPSLLEETYKFTGGYPLCMTLAVDLSQQTGWEQLAGFERRLDKYEVARQLLERLLEQEGVLEVKDFLEKGVVTLWFDVDAIAYILGVSTVEAESIFAKISRFSFTSKTEYGLKFHDKVREILIERLKFADPKAYKELLDSWSQYYEAKLAEGWL